MIKNKKETISILAFATIIVVAVIIKSNTLDSDPIIEKTTIIPFTEPEEIVYQGPELVSSIIEEDPVVDESPNTILPVMPRRMTFGEAFSIARMENGPGSLFTWNGVTYTTSYAEELVKEEKEKTDTAKVNIVLNEIPVKEK